MLFGNSNMAAVMPCKCLRNHIIIHDLKGLSQPHLFLVTCESLPIVFYLEYVEMKEITVNLIKIIKDTFRNTTLIKQ